MEEGTLDRLRNRASTTKAVAAPKSLGDEAREAEAEPKPQAATPDTTGMNRRERRSQRVKNAGPVRTKNKSMALRETRHLELRKRTKQPGR